MKIETSAVEHLGGPEVFEQRVRAFLEAKEQHRTTEDIPAPQEDSLIEAVCAQGGTVEWVKPPPPPPLPAQGVSQGPYIPGSDLSVFKTQAKQRVDYSAEFVRQQQLTAGAGQAMEYIATEDEARTWKFGESFDSFPMLRAHANAVERAYGQRPTENELVEEVLKVVHEWAELGAKIKEERLYRKMMIDRASSAEEIDGIVNAPWNPPPDEEG